MSHLTLEILARIADGPTTGDEAAHLAACSDCRADLEMLYAQISALGALTPPPAPESVWRGVEARLRAEPLQPMAATGGRSFRAPWLLRAAAAAALFLAGTLTGAHLGGGVPEVARSDAEIPAETAGVPAADPGDAL